MQKIIDFENCSGCHSCHNACLKQCISMKPDYEGFLRPVIDSSLCIGCGLCKKVCPVLGEYKGNSKGKAFACINRNEDIRRQSSSGGVFTLLAEYILNLGGVVFGAAFDDEFNVRHIEVSDVSDLEKLRGSKYLQSVIGNAYQRAKEFLESGRPVLFTGTPCQISGLKAYLGKVYDNLFLQDVICHGVPSPKVWQKYLSYHKKMENADIEKVSFRDKIYGWKNFSLVIKTKNNRCVQPLNQDLFMRAFLSDLCLRPSCYNCHSKSIERESDITLADFWGIDQVLPEFFDDRGTSLVIVNSKKGRKLFEEIAEQMHYAEVDINEAIKYNPAAYKSAAPKPNRKKFFKMIDKVPFDKAVKSCCKDLIIKRVLRKAKRILQKVI